VLDIQIDIQHLHMQVHLPLLELVMPALKSLSKKQYKSFRQTVNALIQRDGHISLFEYMLHRMLMRHLRPTFYDIQTPAIRYSHIKTLQKDCCYVLGCMIGLGRHSHPDAQLNRSMKALGIHTEA